MAAIFDHELSLEKLEKVLFVLILVERPRGTRLISKNKCKNFLKEPKIQTPVSESE